MQLIQRLVQVEVSASAWGKKQNATMAGSKRSLFTALTSDATDGVKRARMEEEDDEDMGEAEMSGALMVEPGEDEDFTTAE